MRKALTWSFIIFYVYTAGLWLCGPSEVRGFMLTPTRAVFNYLGLWQEFSVFGPHPRKKNIHVTALVTYEDGKKSEWAFRRIEQCNYWEKMFGERMRKFSIEYLAWDNNAFLRPDFARFLVREQNKQGLRPKQIQLVKHWADTPPPEKGIGKPPVPHNNVEIVYTYNVPKEIRQ
jgi:hypothetical protein